MKFVIVFAAILAVATAQLVVPDTPVPEKKNLLGMVVGMLSNLTGFRGLGCFIANTLAKVSVLVLSAEGVLSNVIASIFTAITGDEDIDFLKGGLKPISDLLAKLANQLGGPHCTPEATLFHN